MIENPQLAAPAQFDAVDGLLFVEQGTPADHDARLDTIVRCPQGFVDSALAFGVDYGIFNVAADPVQSVADALNTWAPDIDAELTQRAAADRTQTIIALRGEQ